MATYLDSAGVLRETTGVFENATDKGISFGPQSFTFTGPNQTFILPCAGAASIIFELSGTFTGSLNSFNSADASVAMLAPARLFRTGAGPTGRSTITGTGALYSAQFRVVGGGSIYVLQSGADFNGSANVVVSASASAPINLISGSVLTSSESAMRAGRAYTTSTGIGTVAGANHMVLYMQNPAGSGQRIFITTRRFSAARQDNLVAVAPQYYGMRAPTTNIPTGVATVSNRGQGSASVMMARFAVVNDANLPTGGTVSAGNLATTPDLTFDRTLEPGDSFCQIMSNTSSAGLGGAFNISMCITTEFYQEPI